ncbi:unnamed protein product [Fraxinus pennsylvanica]|uniref:Uncharacterized protein n=1 Tax=Fraxinus pennsylvanica TaxID=56036 RepID=A0AAD2A1N7_9LAMI|nr:unnamed protein product [Fraxinus pennsylvanica]
MSQKTGGCHLHQQHLDREAPAGVTTFLRFTTALRRRQQSRAAVEGKEGGAGREGEERRWFGKEKIERRERVVAGNKPNRPIKLGQMKTKSTNSESSLKVMEDPLSIKRVGPVGDNWITANNCKMEAFAFNVNAAQLSHLQSKMLSDGTNFSPFEALENNQLISAVKADYPIVEAKPSELAALIKNEAFDEGEKIENAIKKDNGVFDFIFYGANLTFVNLEEAKFYEFDYRGEQPVHVSYRVNGVGEEGVVLVLPGPPKNGGRTVMAILPNKEVIELKSELKREWFMD